MEKDYLGFRPWYGETTYFPGNCSNFMMKINEQIAINFRKFRLYSIRTSSFAGLQISNGCISFRAMGEWGRGLGPVAITGELDSIAEPGKTVQFIFFSKHYFHLDRIPSINCIHIMTNIPMNEDVSGLYGFHLFQCLINMPNLEYIVIITHKIKPYQRLTEDHGLLRRLRKPLY